MRARNGFTLVELLVAAVVLQVGVLGVVGLMTLAARTLASARHLEEAVHAAAEVVDSLAWSGVAGSGERTLPPVRVEWSAGSGGGAREVTIRVEALAAPGVPVLELGAVLPGALGGRGTP